LDEKRCFGQSDDGGIVESSKINAELHEPVGKATRVGVELFGRNTRGMTAETVSTVARCEVDCIVGLESIRVTRFFIMMAMNRLAAFSKRASKGDPSM
jgi:hypothetical protein